MIIQVRVKLFAKKETVKRIAKGLFEVSVTSAPDKGKANEAVVRALARYLGVAPSLVEIIRGHTSRRKVVAIHDEP